MAARLALPVTAAAVVAAAVAAATAAATVAGAMAPAATAVVAATAAAVPTEAPTAGCTAALAACLDGLVPGGTCATPLPVPPASAPPPLRSPQGYNLTPLRPGVYSYYDGAYFSLLLRDGPALALVDFPDSAGSNVPDGSGTRLTGAITEVLGGDVPAHVAFVYSHPHFDHIGAASRVAAWLNTTYPHTPVTIYGTAEVTDLVVQSASRRAVAPTLVVAAPRTVLAVGALEVQLLMAGGHSASDLAVYIPPSCGGGGRGNGTYSGDDDSDGRAPGILHHVDVVFPGWSPFANLAITTDVAEFVTVHDTLLALDWSIFSGGHLTKLGTRGDVAVSKAFVTDLLAAGAAGVTGVGPDAFGAAGLGQVANASSPVAGNLWYAFLGVVRPLQVDVCVRQMLERWGCALGGLDLTVRSACFTTATHAVLAG
ncbi:hypothetical protein I4F81_011687 [Pyropia yezoensis]|uniref:Uncharacterized protein n=1 Tax=Pyropia yezoensis TaxID=2788 RepID=A0ACC3CG31_PYRYE|nr:hypothetical protein I4F81_011687 [Neopyropia yezoensis]